MKNKLFRLYWKLWRRVLILWQVLCGLDFAMNHSMEELGYSNYIGVEYSASPSHDLFKLLSKLDIKATDTILDFGAGKGAAMVTMANFPFRNIAGVEISKKLCDISKRNFHKLKLKKLEIHHSDARDFIDLDEFNYFYFFNPFPKLVFQDVIKNIENSYFRKSRKITLIYYNPSCREVLDSFSFLKPTNKYMGRYFEVEIYQNCHLAGAIDSGQNT